MNQTIVKLPSGDFEVHSKRSAIKRKLSLAVTKMNKTMEKYKFRDNSGSFSFVDPTE